MSGPGTARLREKVTGTAATVLAGRAVNQAGMFALSVAPVLTLTNDVYNAFVTMLTIAALVVVAPVGAFQQHLIRDDALVQRPRRIIGLNATLAATLGVVSLGVMPALTGWHWWCVPVVAGFVLAAVGASVATNLAVEGRFRRSAIVEASSGVVFVVLVGTLVVTGAAVAWWAAAVLVACVVTILVGFALLGRDRGGPATPIGPTPGFVRALVDGRALIAIGVLAMAYNRVDYLILVRVASNEEAARYVVAARLVGPALIVLSSLNNSLYPQLVNLRPDRSAMSAVCGRYARWLMAGTVGFVPLAIAVAYAIGRLSDSFARLDLVPVTAMLALAIVPFAGAVPVSFLLSALGRERSFMLILAAAVLADAALIATVGHRGALMCATVWLAVQIAVLAATIVAGRRAGMTAGSLTSTR